MGIQGLQNSSGICKSVDSHPKIWRQTDSLNQNFGVNLKKYLMYLLQSLCILVTNTILHHFLGMLLGVNAPFYIRCNFLLSPTPPHPTPCNSGTTLFVCFCFVLSDCYLVLVLWSWFSWVQCLLLSLC